MRPMHQFSSTPIDQDAMLESEIITPAVPPADPCASVTAQRDALVVTVADIADRLGDQLLAECDVLKRPMRRWYVRSIVQQMQAERDAAIGSRP